MMSRLAVLCACALLTTAAAADELRPREAWAFMVGKPFALKCSDGTVGAGRILPDGSVAGRIRVGRQGEPRAGTLPPGTVSVSDSGMCARFEGMPFQPCLKVLKLDRRRFHASFSIAIFSYCELDSLLPRSLRH